MGHDPAHRLCHPGALGVDGGREFAEYPLAQAVVRHVDAIDEPRLRATGFRNVTGIGALAEVERHSVAIGNRRLMESEGITIGTRGDRRVEIASGGRTAAFVGVDGRVVGVLGVADAARETSVAAVAALHEAGIRVVLLTGDNRATAERIAEELGIDDVIVEVLPEDKAHQVQWLQSQGRFVAMVADGFNDSPSLVQATWVSTSGPVPTSPSKRRTSS